MRTTQTISLQNPTTSLDLALSGASQIVQRLQSLSNAIGPDFEAKQFYTRLRVKSKNSIAGKIERKLLEKPDTFGYSFRDMTDLVGFRVVTLYHEDLIDSIDYVLSLYLAGMRTPQPIFEKHDFENSFIEGIFYWNKPRDIYHQCHKHLSEKIRDELSRVQYKGNKRAFVRERIKKKKRDKSLYSSGHIIILANCYFDNVCLQIPVEFQVRPAVEDIWAELSHKRVYKIGNNYVWTYDFHRHLSRAQKASDTLKTRIGEFSDLVSDFSAKSQLALSSLERFGVPEKWEEDEARFKISQLYSFSFGGYLFFKCGEPHRDRFMDLFLEYKDVLVKISSEEVGEGLLELYNDAFEQLKAISKEVELVSSEVEAEADGKRPEEERAAQLELCHQRQKICFFEHLRLKATAALTGMFLVGGTYVSIGAKNKEDLTQEGHSYFLSIYDSFCEFLEDEHLLVKPASVVLFWKHLMSGLFNPGMAMDLISNSYEQLKFDQTVPMVSVYRVIIPRFYGSQILLEIEKMHDEFSSLGGDLSLRNSFRRKVFEDLRLALLLVAESHDASVLHGTIKGDIRLGFADKEVTRVFYLLVDVLRVATSVLGEKIIPNDESFKEKLWSIVRTIEREILGESDQRQSEKLASDLTFVRSALVSS